MRLKKSFRDRVLQRLQDDSALSDEDVVSSILASFPCIYCGSGGGTVCATCRHELDVSEQQIIARIANKYADQTWFLRDTPPDAYEITQSIEVDIGCVSHIKL